MSDDQDRSEKLRRESAGQDILSRMSDSRQRLSATVASDWWIVAAAFRAAAPLLDPHPTMILGSSTSRDDQVISYQYHAWIGEMEVLLGDITFRPNNAATVIQVTCDAPTFLSYWRTMLDYLTTFATTVRAIRRDHLRPTADEVIEIYYRRRAAGSKVTLHQLAVEYGFNAKYLSQAKSAYDKRGGWGAKGKALPRQKDSK